MIRSLLPADSPPSNLAATIVCSCFFWLATQHLRCNRIAKPDGQNLLQYLSLYFDPQRTMLSAARLEPRSRTCKLLHKKTMSREKRVMSLENLCDAYQLLREWCSRCSSCFCCSTSHLGSSHVVPGRYPAELPRDSEKTRNVNFHRLKTLNSPARRTCSFHAEPPGSDDG